MKEKTKIFISLMQDTVFKTLWLKGSEDTKEYLNRIIEHVVGFPIKDFDITSNEIPLTSNSSIANKVDILLESKDKVHKVNIELNPTYKETAFDETINYLFKIAGEIYPNIHKDKYTNDIYVEQVNLNGFYHDIKDIATADYKLYDIKNKLENKSIKIHDIYLPRMKELCNSNNEIYLDYAMLMCNSFEEMEKYICGNKERKSVMDDLKNFVLNENLPTYDYGEYLEALHKEVADDARAEGLEEGEKKATIKMVQKLKELGISLEDISKSSGLSIEEIEKL